MKIQITQLSLDPKNARKHSQRNLDAIAASLEKFGQRKPIVVHRGVVLAGNGTLEAAKSLGWTEIEVAEVPEDWDNDTAKAYALADNRTAELAEWDESELAKQLLELVDADWNIEELGFEVPALSDIDGDKDEDEVPEPPVEPKTKLGDIYQLGRHRLMCGDSTDLSNLSKVTGGAKADMAFTDPPYNTGMSAKTNAGSTRLNHFFDDNYTDSEWAAFLPKIITALDAFTADDSATYISFAWKRNHELLPEIIKKFKLSNIIIWDKVVHGLGSDYQYTYEVINVCKKGKPVIDSHQGEQEYQDVWHIQRKVGKNDDHATAKPVELCERAIRHATRPNGTVLDIFGGSGTTLMAAEQTNRTCYMMELDPKYCDVIVTRWENLTGLKAELLNVSN